MIGKIQRILFTEEYILQFIYSVDVVFPHSTNRTIRISFIIVSVDKFKAPFHKQIAQTPQRGNNLIYSKILRNTYYHISYRFYSENH